MTIASKPNANQSLSVANQITSEQKAFISGAKENDTTAKQKSKPVLLRVPPDLLSSIDKAAKRTGLKRASFILSSAAEKIDRMGQAS